MKLAATVARQLGLQLDEVLDVDLGELVRGLRVHALGLEHGSSRSDLHYAFVPAVADVALDPSQMLWHLDAGDDLGTVYDCSSGAYAQSGGPWSHGSRDIVPTVRDDAKLVTLSFGPAPDWRPGTPWTQRIDIRRRSSRRRPLDVRVHRGH